MCPTHFHTLFRTLFAEKSVEFMAARGSETSAFFGKQDNPEQSQLR